jgi:orotidine-5'-phosphate decarboxylase
VAASPPNFADRLIAAMTEKKSAACVGLDIVYDKLPEAIRNDKSFNDPANTQVVMDAALEFSRKVLRLVAPHVAAVKINSAYFERYYWDGIEAYYSLVQEAQANKLLVIGDVKRGDVGTSADAYCDAHLAEPTVENLEEGATPDAVTVNPYFGSDGVIPFLNVAATQGKGVFMLIRTSNESAREFQDFKDGTGKPLYHYIAEKCAAWAGAEDLVGKSGYSSLGAVVGGTYPDDARRLRALMPKSIFLVPGYGVQGATAEDCAAAFNPDGKGAVVSATRSVLYAFNDSRYADRFDSWEKCVEQAAVDMKDELNRAIAKTAG